MSESPSPDFQRPLVISGPSGVGKSTLLQRLLAEFPNDFGFSVSHTTRNQRPEETGGLHYHFVTEDKFQKLVDEGRFMETAKFAGHSYGTTYQAVSAVHEQGRRCILDIEAQGVRQIKLNKTELTPVYLFIAPPSMSILRSRLQRRGTEPKEFVEKRIELARSEIGYFTQPNVADFIIVNDDENRAYDKFKTVARGWPIISDALPPLIEGDK